MNKKIDLDEIIQSMYEKFPDDSLTEIEKARFLYIELGKLLQYNINYYSDYKFKREDVYFERVDFNNINQNKYICKQIAEIYAEILRRAGIDAKAGKACWAKDDDSMPHIYTVIKFKDGREIAADLMYDLAYIQAGLETNCFGAQKNFGYVLEEITPNELHKIDAKIGYAYTIKENAIYTNNFINRIKEELGNEEYLRNYIKENYSEEELKNLSSDYLVKYKFDIISRFIPLDKLGFNEGRTILAEIFPGFFNSKEKKDISTYTLSAEYQEGHKIGNTNMIKCYAWKKAEDDYVYYIYEEGQNLRQISKEDLEKKLDEEAFKRNEYNKIKGIDR